MTFGIIINIERGNHKGGPNTDNQSLMVGKLGVQNLFCGWSALLFCKAFRSLLFCGLGSLMVGKRALRSRHPLNFVAPAYPLYILIDIEGIIYAKTLDYSAKYYGLNRHITGFVC
jgi:hypothetical protein